MSRRFEYVDRVVSSGVGMLEPNFNLPQRKTKNSGIYHLKGI